jgi:Ca2+-binding EF-hand superfamily protein
MLYLACVGEVPDHFGAAVQQAKRPDVYFSSSGDHLQEHQMKLTPVKTLALASLLAIPLPLDMVATSASPAYAASALQTLDPDKDGTVDLNDAKTAASALFDKLDVDHDGTLDRKELTDRISAEDWKIASPDNDKTISKDESLAFVEVAFKRANPDNDGTIDAKEFEDPGRPRPVALADKVSGDRDRVGRGSFE